MLSYESNNAGDDNKAIRAFRRRKIDIFLVSTEGVWEDGRHNVFNEKDLRKKFSS